MKLFGFLGFFLEGFPANFRKPAFLDAPDELALAMDWKAVEGDLRRATLLVLEEALEAGDIAGALHALRLLVLTGGLEGKGGLHEQGSP